MRASFTDITKKLMSHKVARVSYQLDEIQGLTEERNKCISEIFRMNSTHFSEKFTNKFLVAL